MGYPRTYRKALSEFKKVYRNWKEYAMTIRKEKGEERTFDTGARKQHSTGKGTPVLVPGDAILDVAKHFENGAVHYGPRNWEKGIPLSELLNSAERHLQQLKMGLTDESHDRAFVWNAIVYLATKLRIKAGILPAELNDMPKYEKIDNSAEKYKIAKAHLGWYITEGDSLNYLRNDLTIRTRTGWNYKDEPSGYYRTKKEAEETLQAYLDKERCKYICGDCQHEFYIPIIGKFKQGTDLLLNGCPKCGCSFYRYKGD